MISIITPAYNRANTLPRAIDSVLHQTHTDWELIIIDDYSTDKTPEILGHFDDSRIRVLRNEKNCERSFSRNRGIAMASGKLTCFLDSDDEWLPNHLAVHAAAWDRSDASIGACFSQILRVRDGQESPEPLPTLDKFCSDAEYSLVKQPAPSSWSVRTELLREFPFDKRLYVNEDVVVLTKIAARYRLHRLPEFTAKYHMHGSNTHQEGKDTLTPQIRAMKILFADPKVRETVPESTRRAKLLHLRHYRAAAAYKWLPRGSAAVYLLTFLIRYPNHRQNRAKLYLLLNRLPGVGSIARVRRSAKAVIENYY